MRTYAAGSIGNARIIQVVAVVPYTSGRLADVQILNGGFASDWLAPFLFTRSAYGILEATILGMKTTTGRNGRPQPRFTLLGLN